MIVGERLLTAAILFGLSLAASGQPGVDKQPLEIHLGVALSLQEVAERLADPSFLSQQVEQWRNAGHPDIPIESLPPEVREIVGRKEGVIPPEVFFTAEVQKALLEHSGRRRGTNPERSSSMPVI